MDAKKQQDLAVAIDDTTGLIRSVQLYGQELLDPDQPSGAELIVNGVPLRTRRIDQASGGGEERVVMKGERFIDHFSGAALVVARTMGHRRNAQHPCFGVHHRVRRELCDMDDLPCPGPGGPPIEAPLYVDTMSVLNWNWRFWGDDTRMIFPSSHTQGPCDEFGHIGYEHDTPERCKAFLGNVWRRIYPGVLVVHGGLFYNAKTGHWIAVTCRRPTTGYILNRENAGRGMAYDCTLHTEIGIGDAIQLPEIKIYHGPDQASMRRWLGEYVTTYYEEPPAWVHRTHWARGLAWDNAPTWREQGERWEQLIDDGVASGISYSLVTNRPITSGTLPIGYEPDPNHGSKAEFTAMCRRLADRGVPLLVWMSHSGVMPGGPDIDDDWFIKGIDGRMCASWGSVDGGMFHCNPGHPGYIEYTKQWIRYYLEECGCKGIFMDCLGWAFPPDFAPRDFMRFPGDTNRMAIRFIEEIYACIKACDPEAILLGEGTTLDAPINVFSIAGNPVRSIDGQGPRDFFLELNRDAPKTMVVDQGGALYPASGMCTADGRPGAAERNRFLTRLLAERGGPGAFQHLIGGRSILDDWLFLAHSESAPPGTGFFPSPGDFALPAPWDDVVELAELVSGTVVGRGADGGFAGIEPGIYRMRRTPGQDPAAEA